MEKAKDIFLGIAIFSFALLIIFTFLVMDYTGKNYTDAYMIHKEISTFSCTEATNYLNQNQIPYVLSKNVLSIANGNLTYTIEDNKLIPSKNIERLTKLDNDGDTDLVTETYKSKGEYTKRISFETFFVEYYKVNENYFIKYTGLFDILARFSSISCGISLAQFFILKIKIKKQHKNTSD